MYDFFENIQMLAPGPTEVGLMAIYVAFLYSQSPRLKSDMLVIQPLCCVNGPVDGASLMRLLV